MVIAPTINQFSYIKNAGVVPIRLAEQLSINEKVERYTKGHVTHD